MMQQAQNMAAQGQGQPDQTGGTPSGIITNLDEMLGAVSESLSSQPELSGIARRLAALRNEFRSLMTEASKVAKGDRNAAPEPIDSKMPISSRLMADQSQGIPQNPAGNY